MVRKRKTIEQFKHMHSISPVGSICSFCQCEIKSVIGELIGFAGVPRYSISTEYNKFSLAWCRAESFFSFLNNNNKKSVCRIENICANALDYH